MNSLFPLICSDDIGADRDFYTEVLGMKAVFDSDWYVQLQHPSQPAIQIAFISRGHDSVPASHREQRAAGVLVTVEVDDVDAVHDRARERGHAVAQELRDEAWGQRHFMLEDPAGLLVDVVKLIPPSAEFAADYQQA